MILWLNKIEIRADASQRSEKHIRMNSKEHRKQSAFHADYSILIENEPRTVILKMQYVVKGKNVKMPAYIRFLPGQADSLECSEMCFYAVE